MAFKKAQIRIDSLPLCPHCGEVSDVYAKVRAYGWCEEYFDEDGEVVEISTDKLAFSSTKTLRCTKCGKIRRDVKVINPSVASRRVVTK